MILRIFIVLFCFLLSLPVFSSNKAGCRGTFINKLKSHFNQVVHQIKDRFHSPYAGYVTPRFVFDKNDVNSIREALSVDKGDGAAIVDINPFTRELAEKIRDTIHRSSILKNLDPDSYEISFMLKSYEGDWKKFTEQLLLGSQNISHKEIEQFRKEVDQFLNEVRQTIFQTDGQHINPVRISIGTDKINEFMELHSHISGTRYYVTATIAPIGLSTYYMKFTNGKWKKVLSRSGHTTLFSENKRIQTFSEERFPVLHGTPTKWRKRLFLFAVFEKDSMDQSL